MKHKKAIIIGLLTIFVASILTYPVKAAYTVTKITSDGSNYMPAVGDKYVAWLQWVPETSDENLRVREISSGTEQIIATGIINSVEPPATSGGRVAWLSYNSSLGKTDIYMYDDSKPEGSRITDMTASIDGSQRLVDIDGDWMVYEGQIGVYAMNVVNDTVKALSTGIDQADHPSISGSKVSFVGWDYGTGQSDVYVYDISDDSLTKITDDTNGKANATISGDRIAWYQGNNQLWDIMLYDPVADPNTISLAHADDGSLLADFGIDFQGDTVVWPQSVGVGVFAINEYKVESSEVSTVVSSVGLSNVAVFNGFTVWDNYGSGAEFTDVFFAEEEAPDTPPTFVNLTGEDNLINVISGQTITTNPYILRVKPQDDVGITKVEFYVDNVLICTDTSANSDGEYECSWDTSRYHSDISVYAYDTGENRSNVLSVNATVDPALYLTELPKTGINY